jgi:hypothetical protein
MNHKCTNLSIEKIGDRVKICTSCGSLFTEIIGKIMTCLTCNKQFEIIQTEDSNSLPI